LCASSLLGRNLVSRAHTPSLQINAATQRGKVPHLAPPNKQAISKLKQFSLKTYLFFARYTFSFGHHRRHALALHLTQRRMFTYLMHLRAFLFWLAPNNSRQLRCALRPKWAKFAAC
jgi:hypothetical protein